MPSFNRKIQFFEIFLPFLLTTVGTTAAYLLFIYFFDYQWGLFNVKDGMKEFFLPMVLSFFSIFYFMGKRPLLLKLAKDDDDERHFFYKILMTIILLVSIIQGMNILDKLSFDLVEIEGIEDIQEHPKEKYFSIYDFEVDKNLGFGHSDSRTYGRNNSSRSFYIYLPAPFQSSKQMYWYGTLYRKSIDNTNDKALLDNIYNTFREESTSHYQSRDMQNVPYFERLGPSDEKDGYIRAIHKVFPDLNLDEHIFLIPSEKIFSKKNGSIQKNGKWVLAGLILIFLMVMIPGINQKEYELQKEGKSLYDDDESITSIVLDFLNPFGKSPGIAILLLANLGVYLWMIFQGVNPFSPSTVELFEYGGSRHDAVWLNGEYWRLLAASFIHSGPIHLLYNLFSLGICFLFLKEKSHPILTIVLYIIFGVFSSTISSLWYENTVSVGASGALFGFMGLLLTLNLFNLLGEENKGIINIFIGAIASISLLSGFIYAGVDNAAHISGFLCGILFGLVWTGIAKAKEEREV